MPMKKEYSRRYFNETKVFSKKLFSLNTHPLNCISLFSGALGLDLGLHAAGFTTKLCLDFDEDAYKVAKHNLPELPYLCKDITKVSVKEIISEARVQRGEVDLLVGGPPCQPFSKSGQRNGLKDSRGLLFKHYIEILEGLQPRAFILENVRGMFSSNQGKDLETILSEFKKTGYEVSGAILDAANYGVPQFRQRLFLVGFKERIHFKFPEITYGDASNADLFSKILDPFITVEEAIGDLVGKVRGMPFTGKYKKLLPPIPEGLNYSYFTKERGHNKPLFEWRSKFWYFLSKIDRKKPSLTIQAQPGNNTGPFHWENRRLDIQEIARLQTFPDWYEFPVSYMKAHKLIGNAVPCLLAYKLGLSIKRALEEKKEISVEQSRRVNNIKLMSECVSGRGSGRGKLFANRNNAVLA
jgi:DNA (cytosine-5)-methyltransferase 1